jgi:ribonuclease P protein component
VANKPHPLKKSSSFREAAIKGSKKRLSAWVHLQILPSEDSRCYYGITISRKVANSVTRNKLKRWVRNCVQTEKWPEKFNAHTLVFVFKPKFNAHTLVFVFKPQAEDKFFSKREYSEFKALFNRIGAL